MSSSRYPLWTSLLPAGVWSRSPDLVHGGRPEVPSVRTTGDPKPEDRRSWRSTIRREQLPWVRHRQIIPGASFVYGSPTDVGPWLPVATRVLHFLKEEDSEAPGEDGNGRKILTTPGRWNWSGPETSKTDTNRCKTGVETYIFGRNLTRWHTRADNPGTDYVRHNQKFLKNFKYKINPKTYIQIL